jgi:KUP system potassium uptake protein
MAATGISERGGRPRRARARGPDLLLALTLGSIGVMYGDIGMSPLYALKESLAAATGRAGRPA